MDWSPPPLWGRVRVGGRRIKGPRRLIIGLAILLAGCGDDPDKLWREARSEWSAGRPEQAERTLARLARLRPLGTTERLLRAQAARDRGRVDEAIAALGEPSTGGNPKESAAIEAARGTLELARHRFRPAESALRRALELDPSRAEARRELVNLAALRGRTADLSGQLRELSRLAPLGFAEMHLWTLGRREDIGPAEVAEALTLALAADQDDRASRLALAENLRRVGRLDEAEAALGPLPLDDLEAAAARARLALDRGDDDRAAALLAAPVDPSADAPGRASASRLLGRIALARGDAPAAARRFRDAMSAAPDDRDALAGLGQALRLAGDPDAARPFADAARDRDRLDWLVQNARPPATRDDPATLRALGDACLALGRRDVARGWYRLALARNPLDERTQKALFRLGVGDG